MVLPRMLAFPVCALAGQWLWMQHMDELPLYANTGCVVLLTYCWFCVGGLSHELVHQNLPLGPRVTRIIAQCIGISIGIPYSVYKDVHMRHHAYLNTPLDWELWPYSDPNASLGFRRCFLWFDVCFGSLATPLIWGRICFSAKSPVDDALKKTMRKEYLVMAAFWLTVVGCLAWMIATKRYELTGTSFLIVLPVLLAANCNSVRKIMEHVGTESIDPILGTRTVVGRSLLTRLISYFDFDLAVHGPHHRYPKLEHTQLKQKMGEIEAADESVSYPVYQSFTAALLDTARTAILNPGVGVNAGCNVDLSHLPGSRDSKPVA